MAGKRYLFGRYEHDVARATLLRSGTPVAVGHRGRALLHALLAAGGRVVTKAELIDAAWPSSVVEESNLSVQIAALRRLLGRDDTGAEWIVTVPGVGYRFAGEAAAEDAPARRSAAGAVSDAGRKPSLAVLPFANLSGDPGQEYFADGITEDLIGALSRYRWFAVIGRNSSFAFKGRTPDVGEIARELDVRYVLEGTVRKSEGDVRMTARLVDARNAHHLWSDRYDVEVGELFVVQDRLAAQVAGAIEPELLRTESMHAVERRRAGDADARDLVYQGAWHFHRIARADHHRARDLFRRACAIDPDLPDAHVWLARVSAGLVAYGWSGDEQGDVSEGLEAAVKAVRLDEQNPYAHYAMAIVSVYAGLLDQAVRAAQRAIELGPGFALGHLVLGMATLYGGSAAGGIEPLERGLRLNPHDPQNFIWYDLLALAHLFAGDARSARDDAIRACTLRPAWRPTLETLACCHAALGDLRAAGEVAQQLSALERAAGNVFAPLVRRNPQWATSLAAWSRAAQSARTR
jgi:TolB-like protein/tetratricopeptide (TPR) repeat protein